VRIFGRSRDKPNEKRELDPKLNDFIRGVDIDLEQCQASRHKL
jgi:hypothetical protein